MFVAMKSLTPPKEALLYLKCTCHLSSSFLLGILQFLILQMDHFVIIVSSGIFYICYNATDFRAFLLWLAITINAYV